MVTIRDAQLNEKKVIEKERLEEERRLDTIMEASSPILLLDLRAPAFHRTSFVPSALCDLQRAFTGETRHVVCAGGTIESTQDV